MYGFVSHITILGFELQFLHGGRILVLLDWAGLVASSNYVFLSLNTFLVPAKQ